MQQSNSAGEGDIKRALWLVDADIRASLALNRAALQVLAAFSSSLAAAADMALGAEVDRASTYEQPTGQRVVRILQEVRDSLQLSAEEAPLELQLEQALIKAAAALPDDLDMVTAPLRACG